MSDANHLGATANSSTIEVTESDSIQFPVDEGACGSGPNSVSYQSLPSVLHDEDPQLVHPHPKYECSVCIQKKRSHRLLRDPVQTACGHRMCRSCVEDHLGTEVSKRCPANEEDCELVTRDKIFPDPGCWRELKQVLVYCVNRSKGCKVEVKFSLLETHREKCEFRDVPCKYSPRGCTVSVQFRNLEKHVQKCGYQPVSCEQCGLEFSLNTKEEHEAEICPEALVNCPYSCGILKLKRQQLENHKTNCPRKPEECRFKSLGCTFTGDKEEIRRHEQDISGHFQVLLECFAAFKLQTQAQQIEIEALNSQLTELKRYQDRIENLIKNVNKDLKLKMVQQVERLINVEQKVDEQSQAVASQKQEYELIQRSIEQLKALVPQVASHDRRVASHEIRMAEMDLRFQMIETASYDGKLLWKICDFSKRKRDAIEGRTVSLYSQPFYTSRFGYKMCGRVYLNGDGIGRGTHISLYFVVMKGEYDALLQWPFQCKVSLMLLDQSQQKRDLKDEFLPDPASTSFKRPMNAEMNVASGCPLFVAQTVLDNPNNSYVKDDNLFIKIMVDTTNLQPI